MLLQFIPDPHLSDWLFNQVGVIVVLGIIAIAQGWVVYKMAKYIITSNKEYLVILNDLRELLSKIIDKHSITDDKIREEAEKTRNHVDLKVAELTAKLN